jgi:hypothetical protein
MRRSPRHRAIARLTAAVLALATCVSGARAADTVDYAGLFRSKVIKCIHPTVNLDKTTIETLKGAETSGDITTVRFKVYYDGLLKKNSMDVDFMVRQAGSIRQMRAKVLADSGTTLTKCGMEANWVDF